MTAKYLYTGQDKLIFKKRKTRKKKTKKRGKTKKEKNKKENKKKNKVVPVSTVLMVGPIL